MKKVGLLCLTFVVLISLSVSVSAEEVTLTQWQTNLRPKDIEGIEKLKAAFEESHPNIKINIEATPWSTHGTKIMAAFNAGSGLPDVGRIGSVSQAATVGFIRPMDEFITPEWKDSILEVAWADNTFAVGKGPVHNWTIPKFLATEVWFYNKTMFKEAGLDPEKPPQTYEEFTEYAKKLTKDTNGDGTVDQWGVGLTVAAEGGPWRQYMMAAYSFGGKLVDAPSNAESKAGDDIAWNSPETVQGLNWLCDLYWKGYSPPSTIADTVRDVANNFRAGKVAMSYMGPWEMAATREVFDENGWEWGLFRWPEGPTGKRGEFMYTGSLGMFAQTKHPEEVVTYLKFYTSEEGIKLYMKTNGMIPANKKALADPYYSEDPYYAVLLETIFNADLHSPKWLQGLGASSQYDSVWTPIYQQMLEKTVSVEDGVKQMHDHLEEYVND
jgi:ABC-type glycerol-3-phosphate transport system substrate-binding protein